VPLSVIAPHYDALLLSYGASKDRKLNIPGEDVLEGVYSARAFVGWYNGLPEYFDLADKLRLDQEDAVIIGQGNVALDVARILLTNVDTLRKTDITGGALEALSRSRVKRVRVVGRRGPMQAAFTVKELRELLSLPGVGFPPVDPSFFPEDPSKLPRLQKRTAQILQKGSQTAMEEAHKEWGLHFLRSPIEFLPTATGSLMLRAVKFEKTRLEEPTFDRSSRVIGTREYEELSAGMAFRSIGYLSEPILGLEDLGIPFNTKRGLVPNENGRVVRPTDQPEERGKRVPGVYASGWVKRGPTGVIASTMYDAFETADAIVHDWNSGESEFMNFGGGNEEKRGWEAAEPEVKSRGIRPVSWKEWQKIDAAEKERGKRLGKEREKFIREEDMLAVLD
jgi:adrenodoxin-NADP+ reductase